MWLLKKVSQMFSAPLAPQLLLSSLFSFPQESLRSPLCPIC